jgi:hypothetical protein
LTPEPVYEHAKVLAVRHNASGGLTEASEPEGTPNLDVVRGWLLEDRISRIL